MVKKNENLFDKFESNLYEATLKVNPDNVNALQALGYLYTRKKKHLKALEIDRRLVSLRPEDSVVHYNLACSYSNLGKIQESLDALEMAILLGYQDIKHLEQDPDLDNIRNEPRYKELVNKIRRNPRLI